MISINTNLASLIIQQNLKNSSLGLNQAIERMTTGSKLNHAKNNAANFSINTSLKTKLGGYLIAQDNASMGLDMLTTAMDSLDLLSNHLSRLRDLAEQAANGTYGANSLQAIQSEAEARVAEIVRTVNNTEYNKINLFYGKETDGIILPEGAQRVSEVTEFEANGTYYLTTKDDLIALQNLTNSGIATTGRTFILATDIDMSGVDDFVGIGADSNDFKGTFDGNRYEIKNLVIHQSETDNVGLFGYTSGATIKNVGVVNCEIEGSTNVGGLVGYNDGNSTVANSYATGSVTGYQRVGGLVGRNANGSKVKDSYSSASVTGTLTGHSQAGGLVGENYVLSVIANSYATGDVTGNYYVGGLVGQCSFSTSVTGCYATGSVIGNVYVGGLVGENNGSTVKDSVSNLGSNTNTIGRKIGTDSNVAALSLSDMKNATTMSTYGFTEENGWYFDGGLPQLEVFKPLPPGPIHIGGSNSVALQVGIHSDSGSVIGLDIGLEMDLLLNFTTHEDALKSLENIDEYLKLINEKQVQLGAGVNRLESALDSIAVSIQNLTSTKSTINDADIAKESSAYIKSQILQQAASTLLATANQTPSIALGLLQNATIRH